MRKTSRVLITVFAFLFASLLFVSPASAQNANRISKPCSQKTPNEVCIPIDDAGIDCSCRTNTKRIPPEADRVKKADEAKVVSLETHTMQTVGDIAGTLFNMGQMANQTTAQVMTYVAVLPINTRDYVDYVASSFRPFGAQPAYAQGLGFSSLTPVLGLWRIFRNLAYFFFVIIFLVIGFMIMFRSKIGGQAAVTVQQALPKIVVALLLVTFSYAIAGLMIDLMYLIIYLMIGIFSVSGTTELTTSELARVAFSESSFSNMLRLVTWGTTQTIAGHIGALVEGTLNEASLGNVLAAFGGLTANIVFSLVLLVAMLVNLFRVFFLLLQAYVMVIFSVIFAPIQLLLGALPGQNTFGNWLRSLWENLLVFPVVIFLVFVATYFAKAPNAFGANGSGGFAAPQLGLHAGVSGEIVQAFLLFGIISLIPKAVEIAKGLASGKLNVDVGKAMGEFYKQGKLGQTIGLTGLGLGAGALGGAAIGGAVGLARGKGSFRERFTSGAKKGLILGGAGGALASSGVGWNIGKGVVREGFGAATNIVAGDTINSFLDKVDSKGRFGRIPVKKSKKGKDRGGHDTNA